MFFLKYWKLIGVGVLLLAVFVQTAQLNHVRTKLKDAIAAQHNPATGKLWKDEAITIAKNLAVCRTSNANLSASVTVQNAAVAAMEAEAATIRRAAERAAQDARRARSEAARTVTGILNSTPPRGVDICAATDALILKHAGVR